MKNFQILYLIFVMNLLDILHEKIALVSRYALTNSIIKYQIFYTVYKNDDILIIDRYDNIIMEFKNSKIFKFEDNFIFLDYGNFKYLINDTEYTFNINDLILESKKIQNFKMINDDFYGKN